METKTIIWIIWGLSAALALSIAGFGSIFGLAGMGAPYISEKDYSQLKLMVMVFCWILPALQLLSIIPVMYAFKLGHKIWAYFILFLPHIVFIVSFFTIMTIFHFSNKNIS